MPLLKRLTILSAAVAVLAGAVACSNTLAGNPNAVVEEHKGPAGPVPAGLEKFYGQSLSWGTCESYATTPDDKAAYRSGDLDCAKLTVPLDYASPQGRTIAIGLLRKKAANQQGKVGSLVMNPGGPGGSGMSAAASLAVAVKDSDLGRSFDLVGFDPRGIAASDPQVRCLTDQERDAERKLVLLDDNTDDIAKDEADKKDYAAKCAQRTGQDVLANVGTRDVVRDMDVLRSALGDAKLTYLGYSYGTRIGTAYAEAFTGNVRAMVLDGAVSPTADPIADNIGQMAGFQKAFDAFAAWCAAQSTCALPKDPSQATSAFQQLVRPLITKPVPVQGGRELSFSDAITAVVQALYAQQLWDKMNEGLSELAQGKGDILATYADMYYGRDQDGHYSNEQDAFAAVHCVDDPRTTDRNVLLDAARKIRQAAPFMDDGTPVGAALDTCAFWPVPTTGGPHVPKVDGLPPVLVVSTTGDPATPYQSGVDLAGMLKGRVLTYVGTQHTAFLHGNQCVDSAGIRYLVDLTLPQEGTRCTP